MEGLTSTSPKENEQIVYRQIAYVVYFRRFIATLNTFTWEETQAYFHEFLLFRLQPDFFQGLAEGKQMSAPFHWFIFMRFVQHYRIFHEPTMRTQIGPPSATSGSRKRLWIAGYMGPGTHASQLALYDGKNTKLGGMSKCNLIAYLKWLKNSAPDLQEHARCHLPLPFCNLTLSYGNYQGRHCERREKMKYDKKQKKLRQIWVSSESFKNLLPYGM